ncbi:hypothetical protein AVEN_207600-1 [Araneus ventricosus]|uniref:Uncharacterized protein n=1 Tax=Araneus ventricosus TaxID=182803 RepID=A0A4Y2RLS0_ARAVE|nr:hypothetical protein AVEN_207600-1 [Araneus ventricosus]
MVIIFTKQKYFKLLHPSSRQVRKGVQVGTTNSNFKDYRKNWQNFRAWWSDNMIEKPDCGKRSAIGKIETEQTLTRSVNDLKKTKSVSTRIGQNRPVRFKDTNDVCKQPGHGRKRSK